MAADPRSEEAGARKPKKRVRPVRRSGGGALQIVVGLLLALVIFGVIYAVMQKGGMGNYEYWAEYQRTVEKIRGSDMMKADEVWNKIQALPRQKISDPALMQLHETWIEYATAIRDPDDFTRRGAEIEARIRQLESEALKRLGARPKP